MRQAQCICEEISQFENRTPLTLVLHKRETRKTTNTGRLAAKLLKQSRILVRGIEGSPLKMEDHIQNPQGCFLLAYSPRSEVLTPEFLQKHPKPTELVVPDGNWGQASRMIQREKVMSQMTWVQLPPGPPSRYFLRKEPHPGGVSTLEAVARALGIIEGVEIQKHLERVFDLMVQRTLSTRPKNRQVQNLNDR